MTANTRLTTLAFIFLAKASHALPSDIRQPVKLTADTASFNDKKGMTEYRGNVEISQGSLKIKADKLTILLTPKGAIKSAQATGSPASMQQQVSAKKGIARGQAQQIRYNANTGIILLQGNAQLKQDGTSIKGNEIRYSLKAGDFEAKRGKGQRVELIIPPNANAKPLSIR